MLLKVLSETMPTITLQTLMPAEYIDTYSLHWDISVDWETNQNHVDWPKAVEFSEGEIGVNNKKAYMNFQEQFSGAGASFIWSSNLVLDNLVLLRYQVK